MLVYFVVVQIVLLFDLVVFFFIGQVVDFVMIVVLMVQLIDGSMILDIVVIVQKCFESVQKILFVVIVILVDVLKIFSIFDVWCFQDYVLGLWLSMNGVGIQINICGIGNSSDGGNGDLVVVFNFDGVYLVCFQVLISILYDIDCVEVFCGLQGMLYGCNVDVGVINVIMIKLIFIFGGNGEMEVGNYGLICVIGVLNVLVSDKLVICGVFQVVGCDGYILNGILDVDIQVGCLYILWKFDDVILVLLIGDYFYQGGFGLQQVVLLILCDMVDKFKSDILLQGFFLKGDGWSGMMIVDYDFGLLMGILIVSYCEQQIDQCGYVVGLIYMILYIDLKVNLVEVWLGFNGGLLIWIVGFYYFCEQQVYLLNFQFVLNFGFYISYFDFMMMLVVVFGQVFYLILFGL